MRTLDVGHINVAVSNVPAMKWMGSTLYVPPQTSIDQVAAWLGSNPAPNPVPGAGESRRATDLIEKS